VLAPGGTTPLTPRRGPAGRESVLAPGGTTPLTPSRGSGRECGSMGREPEAASAAAIAFSL